MFFSFFGTVQDELLEKTITVWHSREKSLSLPQKLLHMLMTRQYPIGVQTFSRIIREGMVYVDKTDLVWQLAHYATFVFLSRPRRGYHGDRSLIFSENNQRLK